MQKDMKVQSSHPLPSEDAELRDILIAISVVAKRGFRFSEKTFKNFSDVL